MAQTQADDRINNGSVFHYGPTAVSMHLPDVGDATHPPSPTTSTVELVEWHRHLPQMQMAQADHDRLLHLAFDCVGTFCQYIDEDRFLQDMRRCLSDHPEQRQRRAHYSPFLHNAILAIGCQFVDDAWVSSMAVDEFGLVVKEEPGGAFGRRAARYVDEEGTRPMLSTVRGMVLLAVFHWGRGRESLGWMYSGMAIRNAQALGLHLDCTSLISKGLITEQTATERTECFFLCFVMDKLWSFTLGRKPATQDAKCPLPAIHSESDMIPWPRHPELSLLPVSGMKSSAFYWICKVALLAEPVRSAIYDGGSVKGSLDHAVSDILLSIEKLARDLPASLDIPASPILVPLPVILLHCMINFLKILLLRPMYATMAQGSDLNALAVKTCNSAAARITYLMELVDISLGLRYASPPFVQIAFGAGTIHTLAAAQTGQREQDRRQAAEHAAKVPQILDYLEKMSKTWQSAAEARSVLADMSSNWHPVNTADTDLPQVDPMIANASPDFDPSLYWFDSFPAPTLDGMLDVWSEWGFGQAFPQYET